MEIGENDTGQHSSYSDIEMPYSMKIRKIDPESLTEEFVIEPDDNSHKPSDCSSDSQ